MTHPYSPREIKRNGSNGLVITWTDGSLQELSSATLRSQCPCAECREKRGDEGHAKPLTPKKKALRVIQSSLEQELSLAAIWAVGQYAIGLRWEDGHDSGIYTFEYLRGL
jgi:DUF971 family protein